MQPRFEKLPSKLIVGMHLNMSFHQNKTGALWQRFMPRRAEIKHKADTSFYSLEVYPDGFFDEFDPNCEFSKWAGVAVNSIEQIPDEMDFLHIPEGLYAVFTHKGPASAGPKTYQYIFAEWLPASAYEIDNRPHFALMTEKYKHEQEDSEEDIYVPVRFNIQNT